MQLSRFILSTVLLCGLLASPASAERLRLVTGEIVIGDVTRADFDGVTIEVSFPKASTRTFSPDETDPVSYYEALAPRLDQENAAVRLKLAEFCLLREVYGYAVVEARRAAALNPEFAATAEKIEQTATNALAEAMLEDAKTLLAVDRVTEARLYLKGILERYTKAKAATEARRLLRTVPRARRSDKAAPLTTKRDKATARVKLERARKFLASAPVEGHYAPSTRNEQKLRRVAVYAEKALDLVAYIAERGTDEDTLTRELRETAAQARSRFAQASLELGSLFLSRGAVTAAEGMCQRACAIEPENKALHDLHGRILDARVRQRFGGY